MEPKLLSTQRKKRIRRRYFCKICCKEVASRKLHVPIHEKYYNCTSCYKSFKKEIDYVQHTITHATDGKFNCIQCDYNSDDITEITKHISEDHKTRFKCEFCDEEFTVLSWYEEHSNIHDNIEPFECKYCEHKFAFSRYLAAHIAIVHKDSLVNEKFACVLCDKVYLNKKSLKDHMNIHTGNTPMCEICGKSLVDNVNLRFHMRTHTGYKPFECNHCDKKFARKIRLQEHERIHTGDKPHACNQCDKKFTQRTSLVVHMRSHTGEKPFQCHICEKKYVAKFILNSHIKACRGR